jgi:putative ABC transport system ATP-binding protein
VFRSGGAEVWAVCDVSLTVPERSFLAITGPSGSGKTTLLNIISGLDRPTSGRAVLLGQPLEKLSDDEITRLRGRLIGLVFQEPHLLPGLTALENVIVAKLPWMRGRRAEGEARDLLGMVGLSERVDFPPARLSGGERQRVAIARALLGRPRLLLGDEPTGNLDMAATEEVVRLIADLHRDLGITVILVTHDAAVASAAATEVRLVGGRLAA